MIQDFLQYDFLRNSLYAGILIGLVAPLIGVFVVIRRDVAYCGCIKPRDIIGYCRKFTTRKKQFSQGDF